MTKKKRRKWVVYCCAAVGVLLLVILATEGVNSLSKKKTNTSEGLKVIEQAEAGNVTTIENKIDKLEEKDRANQAVDDEAIKNRNYRAVFANSVIMGDSISEAFTEYDLLNASSVMAKIGVELDELDDQVEGVAKINPQVIFLSYGMNDIIATRGDTEEFVKQYDALIKKLQEKLPDTKLFVNSIFPVQQQEIDREPAYADLDSYNEALHALCDKRQIAYIDNTELVSDQFYEEDGVHFKSAFYPYWLNRMAEVASL